MKYKKSFILYNEYNEFFEDLSDEQAGKLIKNIFHYIQSDNHEINLDPVTKMVFKAIRMDLDRNNELYNEKVERMREIGRRGGRPKKETKCPANENSVEENFTEEISADENFSEDNFEEEKIFEENEELNEKKPKGFSENRTVFLKTYNDNVNVNENVNENENENVSLSHSPSIPLSLSRDETDLNNLRREFSSDRIEESSGVSSEDVEILENYVRRKKLATKNVSAYVRKIISNGDHKRILREERNSLNKTKSPPKKTIEEEIASIHDKESAYKAFSPYYDSFEKLPPELYEIAVSYGLETYDKMMDFLREKIQAKREREFLPAKPIPLKDIISGKYRPK